MAYGDFKDLSIRTIADKAYIAKNPKYDGYQRGLASMVCCFVAKKTSAGTAKN